MTQLIRLVTILFAFALVTASVADAKTINVNWRETKSLASGQVNFRVTKIVVTPTSWSVTATVANESPYTLDVSKPPTITSGPFKGMWSFQKSGYGLVVYTPPKGASTGGYGVRPSTGATPQLPTKLASHASWHGTFSGRTAVPKGNELRICFGLFTIADAPSDQKSDIGQQFTWMTDHMFRL